MRGETMNALRIEDAATMTREEWLAVRKTGIGGSDIAAILGKNPYETPLSVYARHKGYLPQKEQTEAMYFGVALEDFVAKEFALRTDKLVERETFILRHPTYDFMLANVDRIVWDMDKGNGVLECKNVSAYQSDNWKEGAPEHYVYQLQWYLGITGYDYGYIAALCGGQKFYIYEYQRDDALIQEMQEAACNFWYNFILEDVQPELSAGDCDFLTEMYSDSDSNLVKEAEFHFNELIIDAKNCKKYMKEAETDYELAESRIKDLMREAETLSIGGEVVATWKKTKRGYRVFKLAGVKE
jgi:putative phage-type endonuclease